MKEIEDIDVPEFDELSVKNLWSQWKTNQCIKQYIPDYPEKYLPERDFFFGVVGTLYPDEMGNLVKKAFKNRKLCYK